MSSTIERNEHYHVVVSTGFGLVKLGEELRHTYIPMSRTLEKLLLVEVDGTMFKILSSDDACILSRDIRKKINNYEEVDVKVFMETK